MFEEHDWVAFWLSFFGAPKGTIARTFIVGCVIACSLGAYIWTVAHYQSVSAIGEGTVEQSVDMVATLMLFVGSLAGYIFGIMIWKWLLSSTDKWKMK